MVLHVAASWGHYELLPLLWGNGADVNATTSNQETVLHLASKYGHEYCVSQIVTTGANINAASRVGTTALMYAAANGFLGITRILINSGANVNFKDSGSGFQDDDDNQSPALVKAALGGHSQVVKLLLRAGAVIDATNWRGETAWDLAKAYNHHLTVEVFDLFIQGGMQMVFPV